MPIRLDKKILQGRVRGEKRGRGPNEVERRPAHGAYKGVRMHGEEVQDMTDVGRDYEPEVREFMKRLEYGERAVLRREYDARSVH